MRQTMDPRLIFPSPDPDRDTLCSRLAEWVTSPEIRSLLRDRHIFPPAAWDSSVDPVEKIVALESICDWRAQGTKWDWRFGNERQEAVDDEFGEEGQEEVRRRMVPLGMRTADEESGTFPGVAASSPDGIPYYDVVAVVGGARLAPDLRARWAAQLLGLNGQMKACETECVVLLGTMRPIRDSERPGEGGTDTYARGAKTEFELLCVAGERNFNADRANVRPLVDKPNKNEFLIEKVWELREAGPKVYAMAAPSSVETERANTADSLRFMADWLRLTSQLDEGARVLMVTSQIYVPYQQVEAIRAIGFGERMVNDGRNVRRLVPETIGFPIAWNAGKGRMLQNATTYLQEVRSTFQACLRLVAPRKGDR